MRLSSNSQNFTYYVTCIRLAEVLVTKSKIQLQLKVSLLGRVKLKKKNASLADRLMLQLKGKLVSESSSPVVCILETHSRQLIKSEIARGKRKHKRSNHRAK